MGTQTLNWVLKIQSDDSGNYDACHHQLQNLADFYKLSQSMKKSFGEYG